MKSKIIPLIFVSLLLTACKTEHKKTQEKVFATLDKFSFESKTFFSQDRTIAIFIPVESCSPCVDAVASFAKENISQSRIAVIAFGLSGEKSIKVHFDEEVLKNPNFIPDSKNYSIQYGIESIAPVFYFFEKNRLKKTVLIHPTNLAAIFDEAELFIDNH